MMPVNLGPLDIFAIRNGLRTKEKRGKGKKREKPEFL
jgi:hypothetical protein